MSNKCERRVISEKEVFRSCRVAMYFLLLIVGCEDFKGQVSSEIKWNDYPS